MSRDFHDGLRAEKEAPAIHDGVVPSNECCGGRSRSVRRLQVGCEPQRIGRVSSEWFSRPADEWYPSLSELSPVCGRAGRRRPWNTESTARSAPKSSTRRRAGRWTRQLCSGRSVMQASPLCPAELPKVVWIVTRARRQTPLRYGVTRGADRLWCPIEQSSPPWRANRNPRRRTASGQPGVADLSVTFVAVGSTTIASCLVLGLVWFHPPGGRRLALPSRSKP